MEFTIKENGYYLRAKFPCYDKTPETKIYGSIIKATRKTGNGEYAYDLYNNIFHITPGVSQILGVSGKDCTITVFVDNLNPPALGEAVYLSSDDTLIVPVGAKEAYAKDPKWGIQKHS